MSDRAETIQVIAEAIRAARINDECDSDAIAGDILTALQAEGMAVVPVEPTEAMLEAGEEADAMYYEGRTQTAQIYKAMLAAALPPSKE